MSEDVEIEMQNLCEFTHGNHVYVYIDGTVFRRPVGTKLHDLGVLKTVGSKKIPTAVKEHFFHGNNDKSEE